MDEEEARKIAVKFFTQIYAGLQKYSLLVPIIYGKAKEDWGTMYLVLGKVKELIDKLQKDMKEEGE